MRTLPIFALLLVLPAAEAKRSGECKPPTINPVPAEWAMVSGAGTIAGQVFMQTRSGIPKIGAGAPILLVPKTEPVLSFIRELSAKKGCYLWPNRARAILAPLMDCPGVRWNSADGEGRFRFDQVPAGEWILFTFMAWKVYFPRGGDMDAGGIMFATVTVRDGPLTANLSGSNLIRVWGKW